MFGQKALRVLIDQHVVLSVKFFFRTNSPVMQNVYLSEHLAKLVQWLHQIRLSD